MIAKDSSNNNFQLTPLNGPQLSTSVKKYGGGAAYFAPGNNGFKIPVSAQIANFGTGDFTIEWWEYLTTTSGNIGIIMYGGGGQSGGSDQPVIGLRYESGSVLRVGYNRGADNDVWVDFLMSNFNPQDRLVTNQWVHCALVRFNGQLKFYRNGNANSVAHSFSHNLPDATTINYPKDSTIGSFNSFSNGQYIDDLRITKGVARYTSNFTPPTAELIDPSDPYIDNVSLLLHGDGSNNSLIITDSSNNNFAVVLNSDVKISQTEKKFGTGSIYFDGSGDYLSTTQLSLGTDDFALECWIYPISLPSQSSIFNQGDSDSTGNFIVNIKSNNKLSLWADNNERYNSTASISLNTWTHLAITRQNGIYYFFINGNLDGTYSGSHNHTGSPFKIGHGYDGITYFNGYIDEARITKGIARYTSNFIPPTAPFSNRIVSDTVPTAGLVARFMADQGVTESGGVITSWTDQSGNNITATPFGNPTRIANQMNGRPAVSFNNSQYFTFNLNATITGPRTYVVLGRYRDPTTQSQQGFLAAGLGGSYDRGYMFKNGSEDRAYFYNGAQIRSPNITLTKYHAATVVHNGIPNYNIYRMNGNNSTEISYDSMNVTSVNQFVIGGRQPNSELLRGEIVEILIYNRQLSIIEIEQIEKYAKV